MNFHINVVPELSTSIAKHTCTFHKTYIRIFFDDVYPTALFLLRSQPTWLTRYQVPYHPFQLPSPLVMVLNVPKRTGQSRDASNNALSSKQHLVSFVKPKRWLKQYLVFLCETQEVARVESRGGSHPKQIPMATSLKYAFQNITLTICTTSSYVKDM